MRKREWWLTIMLLVSVAVVGGMLVTGCEIFKPTPPEPPPPPPNGEENDNGEDEPESKYPDISGQWEVTFKTNGGLKAEAVMTLVQDEDDIVGSWSYKLAPSPAPPPVGGEVEGEVEEDGDVELNLNIGPVTTATLEGEVEDDDEMEGEYTSPTSDPNKTWKAEKK
ncbi:MAG: hypothetical protein HQ559_14145 [Lentisphaerae bacterium]|nr:hypothetical protein [Lentisphaerota bacterium]